MPVILTCRFFQQKENTGGSASSPARGQGSSRYAMMKLCARFTLIAFVLGLCMLSGAFAYAASKTAVVVPFSSKLPQSMSYLERSVPSTVRNKLNVPGVLQSSAGSFPARNAQEARRSMGNADYVVWGSVAMEGNSCVITLNSLDRAGKTWSKTANSPVSSLTQTLNTMTQALAQESMGVSLGGRGGAMSPGAMAAQSRGNAAGTNQDIIVNETGQQQYYLNPQFRYQGASAGDSTRLRSQRLKISMSDLAVGDFNGDGKNEVAVIDEHSLYIYVWGNDGRLKELGKQLISRTNVNFTMRAIDLNHDGAKDLVVTTFDEEKNRPYTYFYTFRNNQLREYCDKAPFFCSVVRLAPSFIPTLIGQGWDSLKLFAPGVHTMVKTGKTFALGPRLNLPKDANVFNFCWIPGDRGDNKLVVLRDDERIKLYSGKGNALIHTTMEKFSGSAVGMDHYKAVPGLGVDKTYQLPDKYFAPMRFLTADLGHTGEYVLLTNKPISTASQFFDRYRYFPQGEIHALYWDGVGLALKWKTRRIRGSVAEIDLADVNNDGILDLVVGLNSSPDLGIGSRQCLVVAYPLNTSAVDPNAPVDMSDFEVSPNR